MNCIFCCVFNQPKYVDMFFLLLESIFTYGSLDNNTDILIYTSTPFMNMIKQSDLFNSETIKFEINDTYNDIDKACKARLDLFTFSLIDRYHKILYLDTDIIVKGDINKLFNVCEEEILYVLEENLLTDNDNFYGGQTLFGNEINNYIDKSAFTSGILLFKNCEKIKDLFYKINEHIIQMPYKFNCYDQPYIVYNAFKYNLFNNKILKSLVVNNDTNIHSDKVIHHFPGGPGVYQNKIVYMTEFLNNINKTFTIPKVLFQTNKIRHDPYVLNMIMNNLSSEWKYNFYDDDDVIQFFINNPIRDLPDIIKKYNYIKKGAHKADLFRYYYLYVKGGFFMDSDAMLYVNIDTIVKNYNFVSVNSSCHPGTIFQGILGASPKNKIIKKALYKAYNTDLNILDNNYHYFCKQLYDIIEEDTFGYDIKLYEERRINCDAGDDILDGKTLLFKHYWKHKIIPMNNITDWNNYKKTELNKFDYRVLTTYVIPNRLFRIGPKTDGGYIIADGFDYDLFISCGIADDIRFEEAFLDMFKIKCIAFDGTINSFPSHKNSMEWIPKNIGFSNTEKTTNLKEYIQNSKNIFLKMDIEGSEFNWLDSMTEDELKNISQIVLEVHWPFDIYRMNMLKKLNNTHYIIHIHGNNYCDRDIPKHLPSGRTYDGTVTINNYTIPQIKLPEVFEVTYINKKLCNNLSVEMKEIHFPTILDYPNNPSAKDIYFSIPL
jgi:hypothetical protein